MKQRHGCLVFFSFVIVILGLCTSAEARSPGDLSPVYVHMIFDGDPQFPELITTGETRGLLPFTGSAFGVSPETAEEIKARVIEILKIEYLDYPNVHFITNVTDQDFTYTWGIDDTAFVFPAPLPKSKPEDFDYPLEILPLDPLEPCPASESDHYVCRRLWGKARGEDPNALHPDPVNILSGVSTLHPTYARTWGGSFALRTGSADLSAPPLIEGGMWGDKDVWPKQIAPDGVGPEQIARAIANNAAHEIAHLFGARHADADTATGKELMIARVESVEATLDKQFDSSEVLNSLDMTLKRGATVDRFEVNDSYNSATSIGVGIYDDLTLDTALDEDWYRIDVTENNSDLRVVWAFDADHYSYKTSEEERIYLQEFANVSGEMKICTSSPEPECATFLALPSITSDDDSYFIERTNLAAGTTFYFRVYQREPRVPMPYTMHVSGSFAGGDPIADLPPDDYEGVEGNDSPETAWPVPPNRPSNCDYSNTVNLQNDTDVDYYSLQAENQSVNVQLFFTPDRLPINLSLDDVQAMKSSLSEDGSEMTLEITGCGKPLSLVKVSGEKGYYNMCLNLIALQDSCIGINDADKDGIADEVDTDPQNDSSAFSDGTTSGIIIDRGDQILTITDAPDPAKGVVIKADENGGLDGAVVSACDNEATYYLDPGEEATPTCGSVITKVSNGLVTIKFTGDNGQTAVTELPAVNTLIFDEELFTLSSPQTNDDPVVVGVGGKLEKINPGDSIGLECINDTAPPVINVSVTPDTLWPPNHKLAPVTTTVSAIDNCDSSPDVSILSITTNEGDEANTYDPNYDATTSDGKTANDIVVENGNISFRAEREGDGDGRVYTITYEATDTSGNHSTASATVTVPHNQ